MRAITKITFKILLVICLLITTKSHGQTISPYLIGNNAWYDGSLSNLWDDMAVAKFQEIRIGGAGAEGYGTNYAKYIALIDGIRLAKAEPIVQVPRWLSAQQAKDFITYINITMGKNIKYWIIGNEPDMTSNYSNAAAVATYIRQIGSALKSVDPTILTIGPETAWYDTAYMNSLLLSGDANDITGKDASGNYYIDVISWHKYTFVDISGVESDVNAFLSKISSINANRPAGKKLTWALTEFNTTFNNDQNTLGEDQYVWSFRAGQLYAELYALGMRKGAFTMTAWSMLEGAIERQGTDLSLFDKDYTPRSNYYHSLMLGQNMKKNYISSSDNQSNITIVPMQDETGVAVMILNKDKANGFDYTLRLNTSVVSLNNPLNININAGIDKEIQGYIPSAATQMLVFDPQGNLTKRYLYTALDAYARRGPVIQTSFCNNPPAINLIPKQYKPIDKGQFTVSLAGITDADKCTQGLTITATSSNPAVVSMDAVNYNSCDKTGSLNLTPKVDGLATITVTLTEMPNSCTPMVKTTSFQVRSYNPFILLGKLEAENFIDMYGVQTQATTDVGGGLNVGYLDQYDWMDYGVRVPKSGTYDIRFRLASKQTKAVPPAVQKYGGFDFLSGTTKITTIKVDTTGGWQTWNDQTVRVNLTSGDQILRLAVTSSGYNLNYISFIDPFTAVEDVNSTENDMKIYQLADNVKFDVSKLASLSKTSQFAIYDLSGQLVYKQNIDTFVPELTMNKNNLKRGVFIAKYETPHAVRVKKFIVN